MAWRLKRFLWMHAGPHELEKIPPQLRPAYLAWQIYNADVGLRLVLEVRMLAGETDEAIARTTGLSRDTINAFSQNYFDIRSRLHQSDYVLMAAIGPQYLYPGPKDLDIVLKLLAYHGGPFVADRLLKTFADPVKENKPVDINRLIDDSIRDNMLDKAAIAARMLKVDGRRSSGKIIRLRQRLDRVEYEQEVAAAPTLQIEKNVEAACVAFDQSFPIAPPIR